MCMCIYIYIHIQMAYPLRTAEECDGFDSGLNVRRLEAHSCCSYTRLVYMNTRIVYVDSYTIECKKTWSALLLLLYAFSVHEYAYIVYVHIYYHTFMHIYVWESYTHVGKDTRRALLLWKTPNQALLLWKNSQRGTPVCVSSLEFPISIFCPKPAHT